MLNCLTACVIVREGVGMMKAYFTILGACLISQTLFANCGELLQQLATETPSAPLVSPLADALDKDAQARGLDRSEWAQWIRYELNPDGKREPSFALRVEGAREAQLYYSSIGMNALFTPAHLASGITQDIFNMQAYTAHWDPNRFVQGFPLFPIKISTRHLKLESEARLVRGEILRSPTPISLKIEGVETPEMANRILKILAHSKGIDRVYEIKLSGKHFTSESIQILAESPSFSQLRSLQFEKIPDLDLGAVAHSSNFNRLSRLEFHSCGIATKGFNFLVHSPHMRSLKVLRFWGEVNPSIWSILAEATTLTKLKELQAFGMTVEQLQTIFKAKGFLLDTLHLGFILRGVNDVRALAAAPSMKGLRRMTYLNSDRSRFSVNDMVDLVKLPELEEVTFQTSYEGGLSEPARLPSELADHCSRNAARLKK